MIGKKGIIVILKLFQTIPILENWNSLDWNIR